MFSRTLRGLIAICGYVFVGYAAAQTSFPAVDANGMLLAQNDAAIERARLHRDAEPLSEIGVNADGMALPVTAPTDPKDDSFGAQMIAKSEERVREFTLGGSISGAFTDNAALTRNGERSDFFGIIDAGLGWTHRLANEWALDVGGHISLFRYDRTPSLDFDNFAFGVGLTYTPANLGGLSFFGRYDFTELLDRGGSQILMEHALTLGVQKAFPLGRSHGFILGLSGTAAIADPAVAQREQIGLFASYHLQLTRSFDTSLLFRPAVHFYTEHARTDFNQVIGLNARYQFTPWADLNASFSYGLNRSDRPVFDYDVVTTGLALEFALRF